MTGSRTRVIPGRADLTIANWASAKHQRHLAYAPVAARKRLTTCEVPRPAAAGLGMTAQQIALQHLALLRLVFKRERWNAISERVAK